MKIGRGLNLLKSSLETAADFKSLKSIGFDALDLSLHTDFDLQGKSETQYLKEIKKEADGLGLELCQAHAPIFSKVTADSSVYFTDEFIAKIARSIKRAEVLDIPYLVIHPIILHPEDYKNKRYVYADLKEKTREENLKFFGAIKKYIDDSPVKIALENLVAYDFLGRSNEATVCSTHEELISYINMLGKDKYVACLDVGHANLTAAERISDFIKGLGDYLKILHVHDNFGKLNDWFGEMDRHLPMFLGSVDWADVMEGLRSINYGGVFSCECNLYAPDEILYTFNEYIFKSAKLITEKY